MTRLITINELIKMMHFEELFCKKLSLTINFLMLSLK